MDRLFAALGTPSSVKIVRRLLDGRPATQEALRKELGFSVSDMSKKLTPLLDAGIVTRPTPRGECRVAQPRETAVVLLDMRRLELSLLEEDVEALERSTEAIVAADEGQNVTPLRRKADS